MVFLEIKGKDLDRSHFPQGSWGPQSIVINLSMVKNIDFLEKRPWDTTFYMLRLDEQQYTFKNNELYEEYKERIIEIVKGQKPYRNDINFRAKL